MPIVKLTVYDEEVEKEKIFFTANINSVFCPLHQWIISVEFEDGLCWKNTDGVKYRETGSLIIMYADLLAKHSLKVNLDTMKAQKDKKKIDLKNIKISDLYSYERLNKSVGIEGNHKIRASTTYVGVEVELENISFKNRIPHTWVVTDDGSLKVEGKEFVTVPIQFRYLEIELTRLFQSLNTYNASQRCSVHVHINARDFSLEELKSFILLYMVFERSMYHFSGNRWNNNFCVPLTMNPSVLQKMLTLIDIEGRLNEKWYKYMGFNLSPLFGGESSKIGTIEFRHMKGTTNVAHILDWINLIVSLKITAKKFPFRELLTHLETMNTTSAYYWLADETFKDFASLITGQPTFKQDVEACIAKAKSVFLPEVVCNEIIELKH